jgi:hypothetical protein
LAERGWQVAELLEGVETDAMNHWPITLSLTLVIAAPCVAGAQTPVELTSLHVCNTGSDTVFSFVAASGGEHVWGVLGWMEVPPHGCNNLYAVKVPSVAPAYLGFALRGPTGRLVSIAANVPAYGTDAKGNPTFASGVRAFCVLPYPDSASYFKSDADDDANHCGDWFNMKVPDRVKAQYAAFTAALLFRPKLDCGVFGCGPGSYYLDLEHAPGSATVSLVRGLSPAQQGLRVIGKFLLALDEAQRQSDIRKQVALQNRFARYKPGSAASWAEQWAKAPRMSPADYDPAQLSSTMIVSGTIERYVVDASGSPQWITIYFKESPNGAFVVCSPYPDMFQEVVGMRLNALIGKTLEVVGPIEQAMCTGRGITAGSVRVLESGMFHIK